MTIGRFLLWSRTFRLVFVLKPILILFLTVIHCGVARAETADISIHVHDKQASGIAWRGSAIPSLVLGPAAFGQLHNSSPSVSLCKFSRYSGVDCLGFSGGNLHSPCPLAYDCKFEGVVFPNEHMFGLVFISQGMINRALVDAIIVTRATISRDDPEVLALDDRIRAVAASLAPPGPTEAIRRSPRWQVIEITKCEARCPLSQSELKMSVGAR
jgi:hypothetical protein